MRFRAFIVGIPLVAVTVADSRVGLAAAILYALAYTLELAVSLVTFFGAEEAQGMKRLLASRPASSSRCPRSRSPPTRRRRRGEVRPGRGVDAAPVGPDPPRADRHVDQQGRRLPAPRRAALDPARHRPDAGQDGQGSGSQAGARRDRSTRSPRFRSPSRACRRRRCGRWFPYCATLMIFIWVVNMLGFIPLPLSDEKCQDRRRRGADARDLRGHVDALRHAGARVHDVDLHARRGHPRERRHEVPAELDPRRARRRSTR